MKTMLEKIIFWFWVGLGFTLAIPFVTIARIITDIKRESDEAYVRRAFRMLPRFLKMGPTEDDLIDLLGTEDSDK